MTAWCKTNTGTKVCQKSNKGAEVSGEFSDDS